MTLSFNTGTTGHVTNSATPSGTLTIPAGVLTGDVIYVSVMGFSTAAGTITVTLTSSATAPVAVGGQQQSGVISGLQSSSGIWSIAAGASDPGATLTFGATGGTGGAYWFNVGLVSYTGALGTDVNGGNKLTGQGVTSGNITTPSLTTVTANDWQLQVVTGGPPGGFDYSPVPPAGSGLTERESIDHTGNAGLLLYMADSGAGVGGAGASIGNTLWSGTSVGGAVCVMASFTVGISPIPPPPPVIRPSGGGLSMLKRSALWADL